MRSTKEIIMSKEKEISEDRFYDILFDPNNHVVEKHSEHYSDMSWHLTTLFVNGVEKAWREITAQGIVFVEIIK